MDAQYSPAEQKVLKAITPPARKPAIIPAALKKLEEVLKKKQVLASVVLGGSLAKGTYLKGDHDIDVFVRFSPEYEDAKLADLLEEVLKDAFKHVERVHGSRDYFHVQQSSFTFEFIPVLHIGSWSEAKNVTDMSPLHVQYVAKHLQKKPWLASDIRLTKQFCKAAKVYGAESYIGGFSGHVIDLLIIYYGGFTKLLEAASKWKQPVVIDPEEHYESPLKSLNPAKVQAPLVIVDPIQPDRNSAAALSKNAFNKFRTTAKEYLQTDDQEPFFTILPLKESDLLKMHPGAELVEITLIPLEGKKDVVGAKCFKVYEYCAQQLVDNDFVILQSEWEFTPSKARIFFLFSPGALPAEVQVIGPPIHKTVDVNKFKEAHSTTFTKEGRIYGIDRRNYRKPIQLIDELLKEKYVQERVKKASCKSTAS